MLTRQTVHIMPAEWRWVTIVGVALVLLTFAPLVWVALSGASGWQFMGMLHNYQDGATYLAKMRIGFDSGWLVSFLHTPEMHNGAFIQVIYPLLGHISRIAGLPLLVTFHVARALAAIFMYITLYQLGATIWSRTRARRVFFLIAALGSGFGWLLAPLFQDPSFPDLTIPEAFPLYSTYMNVHFPLTIGLLALLAGLFIVFFRPGSETDRGLNGAWAIVGLISILLAFLYPQALIPIGTAVGSHILITWVTQRKLPMRELVWGAALVLPALPVAAYIALTVEGNPAMRLWNAQNITPAPEPHVLILGLGLPLLLALPSLWRALRRFERDGDRLMLLWLICIVVELYLPTNIQRRFLVGAMLPIAYFATRAVEGIYLPLVNRRWRGILFAVTGSLMSVSSVLMLFLPILPALTGFPQAAIGIFLERDYATTYRWLEPRTDSASVILASPVVSTWIPGWSGASVIYGHPYETLNASVKQQEVLAWYRGEPQDCRALLETYNVRYVIVGAIERGLGDGRCWESLRQVSRHGDVIVYAP